MKQHELFEGYLRYGTHRMQQKKSDSSIYEGLNPTAGMRSISSPLPSDLCRGIGNTLQATSLNQSGANRQVPLVFPDYPTKHKESIVTYPAHSQDACRGTDEYFLRYSPHTSGKSPPLNSG